MKKRGIINLIKDENSQDVELTYDFDRVAKEVGISTNVILESKHAKSYYRGQLFFKYATLSLFFVTILLSSVIIYQFNNPITTEGPPIEETFTKEQLVAQHFASHNAEFITTPVKSEVINGILVNIYIGILDTEQIMFVYTFGNLTIGSTVQITANGKLESIEENKNIVDYYYEDIFASSTLKIENSYEITINIDKSEEILNITTELNISQFLDYLNK